MTRAATSSLIFQARHRAAQRVSDIQVLHRLSSGFSFQERWKLSANPKVNTEEMGFYLTASRQQGAADMPPSVLISRIPPGEQSQRESGRFGAWTSNPSEFSGPQGLVPCHSAPLTRLRRGSDSERSRVLPEEDATLRDPSSYQRTVISTTPGLKVCKWTVALQSWLSHVKKGQTEANRCDILTSWPQPGWERRLGALKRLRLALDIETNLNDFKRYTATCNIQRIDTRLISDSVSATDSTGSTQRWIQIKDDFKVRHSLRTNWKQACLWLRRWDLVTK